MLTSDAAAATIRRACISCLREWSGRYRLPVSADRRFWQVKSRRASVASMLPHSCVVPARVDGRPAAGIPSRRNLGSPLPNTAMTLPSSLLPEFDQEMKSTRRVLERVPSEKAEWRPHPKSFPLGHLAQLISGMPGWITNAVQETRLDLSKGGGYSMQKTDTL